MRTKNGERYFLLPPAALKNILKKWSGLRTSVEKQQIQNLKKKCLSLLFGPYLKEKSVGTRRLSALFITHEYIEPSNHFALLYTEQS